MSESEGSAPPSNFNQEIIDQFRANNGTMVSGMFKGAPLLLLTTTGAKSASRGSIRWRIRVTVIDT